MRKNSKTSPDVGQQSVLLGSNKGYKIVRKVVDVVSSTSGYV